LSRLHVSISFVGGAGRTAGARDGDGDRALVDPQRVDECAVSISASDIRDAENTKHFGQLV
jgi:hypothetical protein